MSKNNKEKEVNKIIIRKSVEDGLEYLTGGSININFASNLQWSNKKENACIYHEDYLATVAYNSIIRSKRNDPGILYSYALTDK